MNKSIKIVIGILIAIVGIWGIIFSIDYNRCSNMKEPIFTISKQENDLSIKSITYQGLGYRVEVVKNVSNEYGEQITKIEMYMFNKFITGAITDLSRDNSNENDNTEPERIVMVNGKLYYDTGKESMVDGRCGNMDGQIVSNIHFNKIPTENNQSNFEGNYGYQYGAENTIEIKIDNKWYVFETREENNAEQHYFYGVVKESNANYILVEPNEGEEERRSSDLISIGLEDNNDVIYPVEANVKITYTGGIMESYPAQIKATKIELKSTDEFTIKVYDKSPETAKKRHTIIDKAETDKYDYNIYAYDVNVNIVINGKETSLREALLQNKITMNEIISKANQDISDPVMYKDGGSMEYHYDLYTIIKVHTVNGNRDVYIGMPELTIHQLNV